MLCDALLTRKQLAEFLKLQEQTLAAHATKGVGIPFIKVGRTVRYRREDVEAYLKNGRVATADAK